MDEDTPGKARGISIYDFDPHEGRINFNVFVKDDNPSYVITDRARSIIYSVCEHAAGEGAAVCAHKVKPGKEGKARIEAIGKVDLQGSDPCHLSFADRSLAISCYSSGQLIIVPLAKDGSLTEVSQTFDFNTSNQRDSHIHCSVYQAAQQRLLITDLGDDKIKVLERKADGAFTYAADLDVAVHDCHGPRHITIQPNGHYAVVNGECRGFVHLLDISQRTIRRVHSVGALPERVVDQAKGAALRMCNKGKMVYVSDRNFHVINALRLDRRSGALRFRHSTPSGGEHPRDFILSPDGEWLLTANLKSSSVGVFKVDPKGALTHYHTFAKVPTPTSLAWL